MDFHCTRRTGGAFAEDAGHAGVHSIDLAQARQVYASWCLRLVRPPF